VAVVKVHHLTALGHYLAGGILTNEERSGTLVNPLSWIEEDRSRLPVGRKQRARIEVEGRPR
jgi:hypothetical protein